MRNFVLIGCILYFANVYHLAHKNIEHWLEDEYKLWQTWFNNPEYGAPIKHSQCEYFKPMIAGQDYELKSKIKKVGTTSLIIQTDFTDKSDALCASVETVHVFIDKKSMNKIEIPSEIKSFLER